MPYLTNTSGRKLYVQRRISTGEILKRNILYPAAIDDSPLQGLEPDFEYLAIFKDEPPIYNRTYYALNTTESKDFIANNWRISFSIVKKTNQQIKLEIEALERSEVYKQAPSSDRDKLILLGISLILQKMDKTGFNAKEQALATKIIQKGAAIWNNNDTAQQIKSQIDLGLEPNLDGVWEPQP